MQPLICIFGRTRPTTDHSHHEESTPPGTDPHGGEQEEEEEEVRRDGDKDEGRDDGEETRPRFRPQSSLSLRRTFFPFALFADGPNRYQISPFDRLEVSTGISFTNDNH